MYIKRISLERKRALESTSGDYNRTFILHDNPDNMGINMVKTILNLESGITPVGSSIIITLERMDIGVIESHTIDIGGLSSAITISSVDLDMAHLAHTLKLRLNILKGSSAVFNLISTINATDDLEMSGTHKMVLIKR